MKTLRNIALCAAGLLIAASCSPTLKVTSDYDRSVNFTVLKTYSLYKTEATPSVSELNRERITNAVKAELNKKGYAEVADSADFLVNINAIAKTKLDVSANTNYYGYGGMYRPYAWGAGAGMASSTTNFNVDTYKEGSLIIDFIHASDSKMIWEAIGDEKIDSDVKNPDQFIADAVAQILATFPQQGVAIPVSTKK